MFKMVRVSKKYDFDLNGNKYVNGLQVMEETFFTNGDFDNMEQLKDYANSLDIISNGKSVHLVGIY